MLVYLSGFPKPILISTLLIQLYDSHVLRPNPNQIDMVKTTEDVQLPKKYKLSPVMKEEEDFELCRNGQDILICFVCGGAQGGWKSTLPHSASKGNSDCSDAASKLMLSCSLLWVGRSKSCLCYRNKGMAFDPNKIDAKAFPKPNFKNMNVTTYYYNYKCCAATILCYVSLQGSINV